MNDRLFLARRFAKARHKGQYCGEFPYFVHLNEVEKLAQPFGNNAMILAQLQSVLDETLTRFDELHCDFGALIALSARYLSHRTSREMFDIKKEPFSHFGCLDENEEAAKLALIVKACDRLARVKTARLFYPEKFNLFQNEHCAFRKAVYRWGICDMIWWELDTLIELGGHLAQNDPHL